MRWRRRLLRRQRFNNALRIMLDTMRPVTKFAYASDVAAEREFARLKVRRYWRATRSQVAERNKLRPWSTTEQEYKALELVRPCDA